MSREDRLAKLQERNLEPLKVSPNADVFYVEEHGDVVCVFITDDGWAHHKMTFNKDLIKQLIDKLKHPDAIEI